MARTARSSAAANTSRLPSLANAGSSARASAVLIGCSCARKSASFGSGEAPVGSPEWLVGEVFSYRGEAVVLEPADLRRRIADRARELARDLGVSRLRVPT